MTQTQNPGTGTPNQTETDKKEEGAHMTTKSMQMSRSSLTDSHAETKKVTRTEEQSDRERLMVDCRISADASIINFISHTGIQSQMGMLMETTAKAARSILLLAADRAGLPAEVLFNKSLDLKIRFRMPTSDDIECGNAFWEED